MRPLLLIVLCVTILGVATASEASYKGDAHKRGGTTHSAGSELNIVVNYGPGAVDRTDIQASVDAAILVWKEVILDDVTVTFEVDFNGDTNTAVTTTVERIMDMGRDELVTQYQSNLKAKSFILQDVFFTSRLNFETEDGQVLPTKIGPSKAQAKAIFPTRNFDDTNGELDGKIVLSNDDTTYPFDFDVTTPLESGKIDAVAVLVREMGHIFGFISEQDRQYAAGTPDPDEIIPTMLDLYRLPGTSWFGVRSIKKGTETSFLGFSALVKSDDDGIPFSTGENGLAGTWDEKYEGLMVPTIEPDRIYGMQPEEVNVFWRLGWTLVLNFDPCPVALWTDKDSITVGDVITIRGYFFYGDDLACIYGGLAAATTSVAKANTALSEVIVLCLSHEEI
eukprot:CAMPEP_0168522510 /NCGR_PEP_ID=MMETSP0405-20121227/9389_1 /TAXON_ID=498012 /ORGANISM="Trichosphaerium sp, Strain Am-I-7 wt" /LENGTH=392 /DNA_ID=CAMNT_0008544123 /DNA_START=25 /DNA_END=1204 /DNA_ORIENTATION=-